MLSEDRLRQSSDQSYTDSDLEIARMKLSLVERDYASYFEVSSRHWERRNQLRGLEVTLISALAVVIFTRSSIPVLAVLCLYFIVFVFFLLDAEIGVSMTDTHRLVLEIEKRLQATDMSSFVNTMKHWTFGNTYSVQMRRPKYRSLLKAMLAKGLFLWHGGLAVAVTALLFATSIS